MKPTRQHLGQLKRTDCVFLEWEDSHSPDCQVWIDEDEVDMGDMVLMSLGFVISQTDRSLTIASHIGDGERCTQLAGVMTIPKSAIVRLVKMEDPK